MKKISLLFLFILSLGLHAQVLQTSTTNPEDYYKLYSSNVTFIKKQQSPKAFIQDLEENLLSYIKDDKLNEMFYQFYHNGNYTSLKYLSYYLKGKINSKALSLNYKDKLKLCQVIERYTPKSYEGDNCFGDIMFSESAIAFWTYLPHYVKGYAKYLIQGENASIYFYSTLYFLLLFALLVILTTAIRSLPLFIKDLYSLIEKKRPKYESFFWALSTLLIFLYILSFQPIILLLFLIILSFSYMSKKFIPLLIFFLSLPLIIHLTIPEYEEFDTPFSKPAEFAFETMHYDIMPTYEELNVLKDDHSFLSNVALGSHYKKFGKFKVALRYYNKALTIKKAGFVYNNIANIYALQSQNQKALEFYNQAKYHNDDIIYFYNISKVYYRLKDKERAEYYRKLASNISAKQVKVYDQLSSFNINRFFIDKFPTYKEFTSIYSELTDQSLKDQYLKNFHLDYKTYIIRLILALLLFSFIMLTFRRKLKASYCSRCGTIYNTFDISNESIMKLCSPCYNMMNTRSSLKREELLNRERELRIKKAIKKYRDLFINFFLPGSYLFYKHNRYLGVFFIFWHAYYLVAILWLYSQWNKIVNPNFFSFYFIAFTIIEIILYIFTYFKLIKRR